MKKLKNGKAPGEDTISTEMLKCINQTNLMIIKNICDKIWQTGTWPEEWGHTTIIPIFKKGNKKECTNYRTIALIPHVSKILLYIINERLKIIAKNQIPQEQAGFVEERGTREQIFNIRNIIEKAREFNIPMMICFIDYAKAFDCVHWSALWLVMKDMGISEHIISIIRALYENGQMNVRINQQTSKNFKTNKGVRQGCILSPVLFNLYGEYIMRKALRDWTGGISVGNRIINNLRYADDIAIMARNQDEMKMLIERIDGESAKLGLRINYKKTKLMTIDKDGLLPNEKITTDIERVDQFVYLGSLITNNGGCEQEIRKRIIMTKTAMTRLDKIWKNRQITINTKKRLVRALVFSVALYGAETWALNERDRDRINACEMWCWRRMCGISWMEKKTNTSILEKLGIETRLAEIVERRILTYFGHLARRDEDNLERVVMLGEIGGKRRRGRPPRRWLDQTTTTTGLRVETALAEDRRDILLMESRVPRHEEIDFMMMMSKLILK